MYDDRHIVEVRMGYPTEHKAKTRERVVEAASRLFRRYGYNGVGIDDIMAAANLTRGGFYAHFRSKQDLFAATLGREPEVSRALRSQHGSDVERGAVAGRALIDFYLDGENRRQLPLLCPFVSLSADVARGADDASAAYTDTLRRLVAEVARCIAAAPLEARARALAALALCVGGAVLANAVNDEQLATEILSACRRRAASEVEGGRA
jgi:AcrR family transcriptional regulator